MNCSSKRGLSFRGFTAMIVLFWSRATRDLLKYRMPIVTIARRQKLAVVAAAGASEGGPEPETKRGRYKLDYAPGTLREKLYGPGRARLGRDHPAARLRGVPDRPGSR
jgi:hypothetical protein